MLVDIFHHPVQDRILLIKDGKGISNISDLGSEFLDGLVFLRQIDIDVDGLPSGLSVDEVMQSLAEKSFYAAKYSAEIREIEIQD